MIWNSYHFLSSQVLACVVISGCRVWKCMLLLVFLPVRAYNLIGLLESFFFFFFFFRNRRSEWVWVEDVFHMPPSLTLRIQKIENKKNWLPLLAFRCLLGKEMRWPRFNQGGWKFFENLYWALSDEVTENKMSHTRPLFAYLCNFPAAHFLFTEVSVVLGNTKTYSVWP